MAEIRRERSIFRATFEERGVGDTMTGRGALYNGGVKAIPCGAGACVKTDDRQK